MTRIAIDTNVLVALVDSRDKWHSRAMEMLGSLKAQNAQLVYFDCVLNETISVLARRAEEQNRTGEFAALLGQVQHHVPESRVTWASRDTRRFYASILEMAQQTQGALNFHDALIALACRELEIQILASFDQDFDQVSWLKRLSAAAELMGGSNA
jgi:predicted nucleic acid-binding protein